MGTPLPCFFTSWLALNLFCLLFTALEWRGQWVSGPLPYFLGKAGGFCNVASAGKMECLALASRLEKTHLVKKTLP